MDDHEIYRVRYRYLDRTITTKYRFPSIENFLSWCALHDEPCDDYLDLELVDDA